jgi:ABC-2 type transport system permease protein
MIDLILFRAALRDLIRLRKLLAAAVLVIAPAAVALVWRTAVGGERFPTDAVYNALSSRLIFGFILVMLAVVFGTGVVAQEVEAKTIVYLLTRPVARWRICLAKFLAAAAAVTLTTWVATLLLALATGGLGGLAGAVVGRDLLVLPLGSAVYGALFLLVSTLLTKPMLYCLAYAFGWESWAHMLPGNFQKLSMMAYIKVLAPHPEPEGESIDLTRFLTGLTPNEISLEQASVVAPVVAGIALILALLIFSVREYVPRDDVG